MEKTLQFSSTVFPAPSPYLMIMTMNKCKAITADDDMVLVPERWHKSSNTDPFYRSLVIDEEWIRPGHATGNNFA